MTVMARSSADWVAIADSRAPVGRRDDVIDTMRGIAILMVIGIHSLQQPLDMPWAVTIDAALRPCVPVFLFAEAAVLLVLHEAALRLTFPRHLGV